MNNLLFKIKWFAFFMLKNKLKKGDSAAIITDTFENDITGNTALSLYNHYRQQGIKTYILCAFNQAPMGKYLADIRDIYIYNNDPENFIEFCRKKDISLLHYCDKDTMLGAVSKMNFDIYFSFCQPGKTLPVSDIQKKLYTAKAVYFYDESTFDEYTSAGGRNGVCL